MGHRQSVDVFGSDESERPAVFCAVCLLTISSPLPAAWLRLLPGAWPQRLVADASESAFGNF
jgi:hypothetical protein